MSVPERSPTQMNFGVEGVAVEPLGLRVVRPIAQEDYKLLFHQLGKLGDLSKWGIGDLLCAAETQLGEEYVQAAHATGRSEDTLLEYQRTARQVSRSRRRPELSFTHHQVIASMEPDDQVEWLDRAVANGWSVGLLRDAVREWREGRGALSARRNRSRSEVEVLEHVESVARAVVRSARPADCVGTAFAAVPVDVLDRLANALGPDDDRGGGA